MKEFNGHSGKFTNVNLEIHCKNLSSLYYQLIGHFQSMWRARSKITLVQEKQVLTTCSCGELFPKGDDWVQFHSDALFLNNNGMGKLLRGVCVRLFNNPERILKTTLYNDIDNVQGLICEEVLSIKEKVNFHIAQIPLYGSRHTGWGWEVDVISIMGGCERCFSDLIRGVKTDNDSQAVNSAVDRIVSSGFWLKEDNNNNQL